MWLIHDLRMEISDSGPQVHESVRRVTVSLYMGTQNWDLKSIALTLSEHVNFAYSHIS